MAQLKTYFLVRLEEAIAKLPASEPERIHANALHFQLINAYHMVAKDILSFRYTMFKIFSLPDDNENKIKALAKLAENDGEERQKASLAEAKWRMELLQFMILKWYKLENNFDTKNIADIVEDPVEDLIANQTALVQDVMESMPPHEKRYHAEADKYTSPQERAFNESESAMQQ